MKHNRLKLIIVFTLVCMTSCSTNKKLLNKRETEYGSIRFYLDNKIQGNIKAKRILAIVNDSIFYSFYPDRIVKQTTQEKNLISTLFFRQVTATFDTTILHSLSSLDLLILQQGDNLLDSLKLTNYKKSTGAVGFEAEVNYYHGYPDNRKFRP